jgi:hypothetical protein
MEYAEKSLKVIKELEEWVKYGIVKQ